MYKDFIKGHVDTGQGVKPLEEGRLRLDARKKSFTMEGGEALEQVGQRS